MAPSTLSSRSSTLAVVALLLAALTMLGSVQQHWGAIAQSCATNSASPTVNDANICVQYIRGLGGNSCCQLNGGAGCTTMRASGSAAVDICGNTGCTSCANAGDALNLILARCVANANGARVSGTNSVPGTGLTVRIRRS